jgi:hypothetical protein
MAATIKIYFKRATFLFKKPVAADMAKKEGTCLDEMPCNFCFVPSPQLFSKVK